MWIIFSFLVAIFDTLKNVVAKLSLRNVDEYIVAWSNCFFSIIFLLPFIFDIPEIKPDFYFGLFVSGFANVLALVFFMKSIKLSDLSKTIPLTTLSPLLLLITSPLIVGELPNFQGILGIAFIVLGAYLLNFSNNFSGVLAPFKAIYYEAGPRYMLFVVLLWSISANFDKIGVKNSSPLFYAFSVQVFISVVLFFILLYKKKFNMDTIKTNIKYLFGIGFLSAGTIYFYTLALQLTLVPYVIAIKRTNSILSVISGWLFFKETKFKERIVAAIIMFIGVLLITFS